jgi:hypothetical protein
MMAVQKEGWIEAEYAPISPANFIRKNVGRMVVKLA